MTGQGMTGYVLLGRPGTGSSVCEAVLVLSGLDYTIRDIDKLADGSAPPELLAVNPLGQVPVLLLPDKTVMTESAAIAMHIADLSDNRVLAPKIGDPDRAAYLRLMIFMATNNYMTDLRYFYSDRYSTDPAHAAAIKAKAIEHQALNWRVLEDAVGTSGWLIGPALSAADIYLAMLISWADDLQVFSFSYPRLAQIAAGVAADPHVRPIWRRHGIAA
jgi:glutathione S-transferase